MNFWLIGRFVLWSAISAVFVISCMLVYYLFMHAAPTDGIRQSIVIAGISVFAFGFSKDFNKAKRKGND